MHGTNVQSVIVSETVTIIAVCIESRDLAEIAGVLTLITTQNVDMPIDELSPVTKDRIARSLADANWRNRISSVLGNPNIIQLSELFIQRCHQCVPSEASNPLMDEAWLRRVQTAFFHDEALQMIARAIVGAIPIPQAISEPRPKVEASKPAPVIREVPAPKEACAAQQPIVAPAAPATSAPSLHDAMGTFVAHLERLQKAQQVADAFMQFYNAQRAREAAGKATPQRIAPTPEPKRKVEGLPAAMQSHKPRQSAIQCMKSRRLRSLAARARKRAMWTKWKSSPAQVLFVNGSQRDGYRSLQDPILEREWQLVESSIRPLSQCGLAAPEAPDIAGKLKRSRSWHACTTC